MGLKRDNRQTAPKGKVASARELALATLQSVLRNARPLGEALESAPRFGVETRDVGFARAIAMSVLRHFGQTNALIRKNKNKNRIAPPT